MTISDGCSVLVISGIPGSGKTTIARRLAEKIGIPLVEMDRHYLAPANPAEGVDFSDPRSIDLHSVLSAIEQGKASGAPMLIVEGIFALAIPEVRNQASRTVWVDAPMDIALARKLLRKLDEGAEIRRSIRGYLERARARYVRYVLPASEGVDLHLDGGESVDVIVATLIEWLER